MPEAVWVAIIVQSGGILAAIIAGARKLGRIEHEVKPNSGASMADGVHRIERYAADLDKSVRGLARSLDRRTAMHEQALTDAVADRDREFKRLRKELPQIIEDHVHACPLRNPPERPDSA